MYVAICCTPMLNSLLATTALYKYFRMYKVCIIKMTLRQNTIHAINIVGTVGSAGRSIILNMGT